ncbi:uncharacterized protein LOC132205863 [Neocloeon triangulifer]|uniref:uncharacterized protein LOC132205863 n=1 Tax=Neocloeon triangulifer TaxID=2078957 RepID=UPI00286EE7B3|nr:uncharacterized protein LOC132205863 [Neocloeon triangulifer]
MSISLGDNIHKGSEKGYPKANLGYFQSGQETENADNVFVLVVHYDFKDTKGSLAPRLGDEKDVENLRVAFEKNRNCAFRELLSPKKDDLLNFLKDEHNLKLYFGAPPDEPAVFFLIILSHGTEDGVIFTDTVLSLNTKDEYETFTTEDVFKSIRDLFPKCLKGIFFGPCRGSIEERIEKCYHTQSETKREIEHAKNRNSCRITFEPNMRNLVILYSTVETTVSQRRVNTGTWLVECLCEHLNKMGQNEDVLQFFTAIQNKIHHKPFAESGSKGQTPELKMFTCDRRFFFHVLGPNNAVAGTSRSGSDSKFVKIESQVEKPQSIQFDWWDSDLNAALRGRSAVIFHQGEKTIYVSKLEAALNINLGFDTKTVIIDKELEDYFTNRNKQSWRNYGCFAAFFFAEIAEKGGEVCIQVSENVSIPVGKLLHRLLGPKNDGWIGKPKPFFLLNTKFATTDCAIMAKRLKLEEIILPATKNSGWMVLILQNIDIPQIEKFVDIFQSQEIKQISSSRSLQDYLVDFLIARPCNYAGNGPDAMMVSTLHCLLNFPQLDKSFVKPIFTVDYKADKETWDGFVQKCITQENQIFLLPSFPGSGKSTVMRELAFEMERKLEGATKIFLVILIQTSHLFYAAKREGKVPSLASIVSHATGTREIEIQNLIHEKKIMLLFDGFDEIYPLYRNQVRQVFAEAVLEKVPLWVSTRPHIEGEIFAKPGTGNKICRVQIMPLDDDQQIEFLCMTSKKPYDECRRRINFYRVNGSKDILENRLHLKMIAELDYKEWTNLYEIYEEIVQQKLKFVLNDNLSAFQRKSDDFYTKLKQLAVQFLFNGGICVVLEYPNNGIVTISNGRAQFVHQTFAEFLAAAHFVDWLHCEDEKMPFDIFKKEVFRQVRNFINMKIRSMIDDSKVQLALERYLQQCLTKFSLENFILREKLDAFASVAVNLITFIQTDKNQLNYVTTNELLVLACKRDENFALQLLNKGAYEKLTNQNTCTVEMLAGAIRNNFVRLFSKIQEKWMDLVQKDKSSINQAVIEAVGENHHKILQLLLEKGIVNASDKDNFQAALRTAVERNSVECVQFLIENTPRTAFLDVTAFGSDGFLINIETTKALLNTNDNADEPKTSLASRIFNSAVKYANADVAIFLLQNYGNVEDADFKVSPSALLDVSKWDDSHDKSVELCRWLVEKRRFKVYENDVKGHDAIFYAEKRGNSELCTYLKER